MKNSLIFTLLFTFLCSFSITGHSFNSFSGSGWDVIELGGKKGNALQFHVPYKYVKDATLVTPMTIIIYDHQKQQIFSTQSNDLSTILPIAPSKISWYIQIKIGTYTETKSWNP